MSEKTIDVVAQDVVVSMDYSLTVEDQLIDSSESYGPLEYIQGHNNIVPGLEKEILGMQIGDSKEVVVKPEEGYGEYNTDALTNMPRSQFPPDFNFEIGKTIHLRHPQGQLMAASIVEIGENDIRLDLNHPLAGKVLNFSVKVVNLRMATPDEVSAGRVGGDGCESCGSSEGGCGGGCG